MDNLQTIAIIGGALLFALLFWIILVLRRVLDNQNDAQAINMLQNQINANAQQSSQMLDSFREQNQKFNSEVIKSLESGNKNVGDRLDGAAKVIGQVNKQLGKLDESSQRIFEVGKDVAQLQNILKSPKLRGNIGELFLGDLLSQIMPAEHFQLQHRFQSGEIVDAVIKLESGLVPVDSKFPLENFIRLASAENENAKNAHKKDFLRDVKTHIDAISSKYIRPDEYTFDFALMYIPAENVYYEVIIKDENLIAGESLYSYCLKKRVIPVSPNSFYSYLQTILLGLKGMKIDENILTVVNNIAGVRKELERFEKTFEVLGGHINNIHKKYNESEQRLTVLAQKIEQTEGLFPQVEGSTQRSIKVLPEKNSSDTEADLA